MKHPAIDRLFKKFGLKTKGLSSFRFECKAGAIAIFQVTYVLDEAEMDDITREFKEFILIEYER